MTPILTAGEELTPSSARHGGPPRLTVLAGGAAAGRAPVLVAGSNTIRRDTMIAELRRTMAPGTRFVSAAASWEVLALAATSSMVVLSGELEGIPSESLMRLLSQRYPALALVGLDAEPELAYA